jgi:hypothetical protein
VHERDEDLAALEPQVADDLLDDGVTALVALVAEPLMIRLAVCRCFLGACLSSWRIWAIRSR